MKKQKNDYHIRNCIFAFKCKANWAELEDTNKEKTRYCKDCQKEVHFCENDKELIEAINEDFCVAFERLERKGIVKLVGIILPTKKY